MGMYRVGKKVGVLRPDPQANEYKIESGRIVARRLVYQEWIFGEYSFKAIYAVRLSDGRIIECNHDELWTKVWRKEK